jgi:hypothetical protein
MSEESITATSSFNPVRSRDIAVMEDTPLRSPTSFEQHMPIINGMPFTPRYDAFSQFTERDFDDGFNEFFHNRVKPITLFTKPSMILLLSLHVPHLIPSTDITLLKQSLL